MEPPTNRKSATSEEGKFLSVCKHRMIVLKEIEEDVHEMVRRKLEEMAKVSSEPVHLIMHCVGGWGEYLQLLWRVLDNSPVPVFGVAVDGTLTGGFIDLLQHCRRRFVPRETKIVFHPPGKEQWTAQRITPLLKRSQKINAITSILLGDRKSVV